jgi:hypothetical protein
MTNRQADMDARDPGSNYFIDFHQMWQKGYRLQECHIMPIIPFKFSFYSLFLSNFEGRKWF